MKKTITFFAILFAVFSLNAADIIVTTVSDELLDDGSGGTVATSGSFREAVSKAVSGDVIKFNVTDGTTIALQSSIGFTGEGKVLVVDGLNMSTGEPIILTKAETAAAGTRMINIGNGAGSANINITLKNISFENASSTTTGTCITSGNSAYQTGYETLPINVTLENCQFKNNTSSISVGSSSGGGAAYMLSHGSNLIVKNCLFVNNKQTFSDETEASRSKAIGGGCFSSTGNNTAHSTFINCTFIGNSSLSRGGTIFTGHPIDLINCTFAGNSAAQGGGFYFHNNNSINIVNCIFTHNYSLLPDYEAQADLARNNGTFNMSHVIVGETNVDYSTMSNITPYASVMPLFASYETNSDGKQVPVLADNGGTFSTLALASNGVATAQGTTSFADLSIPTTDQRGYTRNSPPSIGAFEYGASSGIEKIQYSVLEGITTMGQQIVFASNLNGVVNIYNTSGICVYRENINGGAYTPELSRGVYFVTLTNDGKNQAVKVLVR